MRQRHEDREDQQADRALAPGRHPEPVVEERVADGDEPPGEDEQVQDEDEDEGRRDEQAQPDLGRALEGVDDFGDGDEDEDRDGEEPRRAGSVVLELAEAREERRQSGCREATSVGRSGIRPDRASMHLGARSPFRVK